MTRDVMAECWALPIDIAKRACQQIPRPLETIHICTHADQIPLTKSDYMVGTTIITLDDLVLESVHVKSFALRSRCALNSTKHKTT